MDLFSADRDPRRLAKLNWPWTPLWCDGFVQMGNLNIVPDRTEQPLLIPWTHTPNTEMFSRNRIIQRSPREDEPSLPPSQLPVSPPRCLPILLTHPSLPHAPFLKPHPNPIHQPFLSPVSKRHYHLSPLTNPLPPSPLPVFLQKLKPSTN